MQMRRTITSIFLALALLVFPISDWAQQSSPAKPQASSPVTNSQASSPDANPQAPAPAQSAGPKQDPTQQSDQTIKTVVNLVDVLFTVLNRRNKLVPELEKGDFKIWDDKAPQEIRYFSRQSDLPLRIGMLLDTSNSIRDRIKFEQDASVNFLFSVLRRNKDEAFVMTFDDEPQIVQGFTGDAGALRDQITKTKAGGGTAIYDAVYEACVKQLSHPPRPPGDQPDVVRRVMILISDGEDNLSTHTRTEAIEMAQRTSVVIYTISTSIQWVSLTQNNEPSKSGDRKYHLTDGDKILQELAEETGGRESFRLAADSSLHFLIAALSSPRVFFPFIGRSRPRLFQHGGCNEGFPNFTLPSTCGSVICCHAFGRQPGRSRKESHEMAGQRRQNLQRPVADGHPQ